MEDDFLTGNLIICIACHIHVILNCLLKYFFSSIMLYRDGVGEGQLSYVIQSEVESLKVSHHHHYSNI